MPLPLLSTLGVFFCDLPPCPDPDRTLNDPCALRPLSMSEQPPLDTDEAWLTRSEVWLTLSATRPLIGLGVTRPEVVDWRTTQGVKATVFTFSGESSPAPTLGGLSMRVPSAP